MGVFIWHQWARFVAIFASVYAVWAGFWGIFYRKFFWDFVGGVRMNTATQKGIIPGANAAPFLAVIVSIPLLQIFAMILGVAILMMEYPAPFVKGLSIHRSLAARVVLLLFQTFLTILFYQGTNAAIYSFIAAIGYTRALMRGEIMDEAKGNRGTQGPA